VRGSPSRWAHRAWIVLPILTLGLYAWSFNSFPALERQKGILGDAANFKILLERWSLGNQLGDEYATNPRRLEDVAQKHKIHHVLFGMVGRPIYLMARAGYRAVGIDPGKAVYAVNAVITALTIILLYYFLKRVNPYGNPLLPFLALYSFSLSTWLWGSVPGSWPLSGAFTLLILFLAVQRALPGPALAALLGIFMLNNMTLGLLVIALSLPLLAADEPLIRRLARCVGLAAIAGGVWLAGLFVLAQFDPSFRPDRLLAYSAWFKRYLGQTLPPTSLYTWKAIFSNLFVTSFASNQPNPKLPPEAMALTLRDGPLGAITTLAVVGLLAAAAWLLLTGLKARARLEGWRHVVRDEPAVPLAAHCVVQVLVTAILSYASGAYYAPTVVPLVVLLLCRYVDLRKRPWQFLTYATIALVIINNAVQVDRFRDALRVMP
jgi:hypothetical protein